MLKIKNEEEYIKILFSMFMFVFVVLAILGKNILDYIYIGVIFTFIIESFIK